MFRFNPFNNSRVDNFVPNKHVKASVRTKPITVSQPHVITKKDFNSDSNGLSSTGVDNTAKTRRPQPRSNTKNDRVPSASKSSWIKNKEVEVEEYLRNLMLSKNKKHMSSEFINIKLSIQNDKSKVICAMCYSDLQWGNILITRFYFVEGLGYNLFSVGQFCDLDLEVAFRRNTYFVKNLEGVDLLKGNRTTNLYTINLHEMASASPISLIARATSTKSCINEKRYALVIVDDYSRYTWVHFLRSKDEALYEIKTFLKKIIVLLQAPVIINTSKNEVVERRNRTLVEAARTMLIFSCAPLFLWAEAIVTACYTQTRSIIHRRFGKTPYELINGKKPDISFLHVFGALCYPKNDRDDIRKLGAKGDIDFISFSATSCAYRVYNRRTKKIMEMMNIAFNELLAMAFEQHTGSTMEPKNVKEAMIDPAWIESMQKELLQFKRLDLWVLVPVPDNIKPLMLKWLFKNKLDEENTVIRNETHLVVRGYRQEE
ncbi:retrovirus-related pol polyprotein from transposon TNT 1-94 [Tanacetum coccineum]